MRLFLLLRSLAFLVLLPGMVAVYVPFLILSGRQGLSFPPLSLGPAFASALILVGAAILLQSVWHFFAEGRGTLAPVDPPKVLVVQGAYRFTRNPMYNGVIAVLAGEACLFTSRHLLIYAVGVFLVMHLFVVLYEERTLEARFGESYRTYKRVVPRWGLTFKPYEKGDA